MFQIDFSTVVQALMVMVLAGVGGTVWRASTTLAALSAAFEAHKDEDDKRFDALDQDIREVRAARR